MLNSVFEKVDFQPVDDFQTLALNEVYYKGVYLKIEKFALKLWEIPIIGFWF